MIEYNSTLEEDDMHTCRNICIEKILPLIHGQMRKVCGYNACGALVAQIKFNNNITTKHLLHANLIE